jgi:hypothetical protein
LSVHQLAQKVVLLFEFGKKVDHVDGFRIFIGMIKDNDFVITFSMRDNSFFILFGIVFDDSRSCSDDMRT